MNAPAMPQSSGVPVHINVHALSLLVVVGYNLSLCVMNINYISGILRQQFITAKKRVETGE